MSIGAGANLIRDGLSFNIDLGNKKYYSPNVFPYSRDVFAWNFSASGANIFRDETLTSPAGGVPVRFEATSRDVYSRTYASVSRNLAPTSDGESWVVSGYFKGNRSMRAGFFLFGADNATGSGYQTYGITAQSFDIGTEWTRLEHFITFGNTGVEQVQIRIEGPDTYNAGDIFWIDGLQLERGTVATEYTPNINHYYVASETDNNLIPLVGNQNESILIGDPKYDEDGQGSFDLDGSSDCIDLNQNIVLSRNGSTCSFWIKTNTVSRQTLLSATNGAALQNNVELSSNGLIAETNTNCNQFNSPSYSFEENTWYNIAFTFDNSKAYWYINGEFIGEAATYGNLNCNPETPASGLVNDFNLRFVAPTSGYSSRLNGKFSSLQVYNRALSSNEITQNFGALRARYGI